MTLPLVLETMRAASPPRWSLLASLPPQEACFLDMTWVSQVSLSPETLLMHLSSAQTQKTLHCKSSLTSFMIVHRWCVIFPVFLGPLLPRGAGRKEQKCLLYLQQPEAADLHFFILPCWFCLLLLLFKRGHDMMDAAFVSQ